MGRKTWDANPWKPFPNTINFVLSRTNLDLSQYPETYTFKSLDEAVAKLEEKEFQKQYEDIWVIGGNYIYKV